jgi:hypothetical protein
MKTSLIQTKECKNIYLQKYINLLFDYNFLLFKFVNSLTRTKNNKTMSNVQTTQQLGYSFDIAITKTNDEQAVYLQSVCNQRQLAELRPRFEKASLVDKNMVINHYHSIRKDAILDRDFDWSKNAFEGAEIFAMEEAIHFATELEEKENRFCEYENERPHGLMQFR